MTTFFIITGIVSFLVLLIRLEARRERPRVGMRFIADTLTSEKNKR